MDAIRQYAAKNEDAVKALKRIQAEIGNVLADASKVKKGGRKNAITKAKKVAKKCKPVVCVAEDEKPKRALSDYNVFMKEALARLRKAEPDAAQKELFRAAVAAWKEEQKAVPKAAKPKAKKAAPRRSPGSLIAIARGLKKTV